jgi:hypothetical protein
MAKVAGTGVMMTVDTDASVAGVAVMAGAATMAGAVIMAGAATMAGVVIMAGVVMLAAGRNGAATTAIAAVLGDPKAAGGPPCRHVPLPQNG